KLGDISEILLDKSGKVDGVVIGVGGFLGMGTHDIKFEMSKLKFVDEPIRLLSFQPRGLLQDTSRNALITLTRMFGSSRGRPGPGRSPSRMGDTRRLGTTPVNNNPCTRGTRVIESTFDYYRTSLYNSRGEKAQAP